ncbi:hypothetical protein HK096_006754 [Nowakowskiella sp. JEL0078]|nr:hypothetical protein HK096_006754 [Nowakowskiella sp. JEL0078]
MRYDGIVVDPEMLENEANMDFKSEPLEPTSPWNHLMRWYAYLFLVRNRDFERFRQIVNTSEGERFDGFGAMTSAALAAPGALIAVHPAAVSISNTFGDSSTEVGSSSATAGASTPSTLGRLSLWSSSVLSWTTYSPTPWRNASKSTAASSDYSSKSDSVSSPLAGTPVTQRPLNRIVRENQMLVASPVDDFISLGRENKKSQPTPQRNFSWGRFTHNILLDGRPTSPNVDDDRIDNKGKKSTSSLDEVNLTSNPSTQRTFGGDIEDRNKTRSRTDSGPIRPTWTGDEQKTPSKSILARPSLASMKSSKRRLEFDIVPTEETEDEKTTIISRSSTINRKVHSAGPSGRHSPALTINTERTTSFELRERERPPRSESRASTASAMLDLPRWDPKRKNRTISGPKALWGRTESRSSRPGSPASYLTRSGTPSSLRSEFRDDRSMILDLGDDELNIESGKLTPARAHLISFL